MPSLSDKLKRLLDTIALTDAGEMMSAREKRRLLDLAVPGQPPRPPQPAVAAAAPPQSPPAAQHRSVVLGVGQTLSLPALDYAAGACARLDAGLVLLCTDAALAAHLLEAHMPRLAASGVVCRIVALGQPSSEAVADFIQNDSGVLFAVTAGNDPVATLAQRSGKGGHKSPPAPIVMVSDIATEAQGTVEFRRFKRGAAHS